MVGGIKASSPSRKSMSADMFLDLLTNGRKTKTNS